MDIGERQTEFQSEKSVYSQEFQDITTPAAAVFHEGRQVRIRLQRRLEDRSLMIPLRNGFPLYAADRTAQCFSVIDASGRRVAFAVRIPDFGIRLVFDSAPSSGDYFIRTQTPYGRA